VERGLHSSVLFKMVRLGLCCGFVREEHIKFRTTTVRYASTLEESRRKAFLFELAEHNATTLRVAIEWCRDHRIGAFRVQSGLLPLYTHPELGWRFSDGSERAVAIADMLRSAGEIARAADVRLSFHPDQFVVLGSLNEKTVALAVSELEYQAECGELIGAAQMTIHGGGAVQGKEAALERLRVNLSQLSPRARKLLVLENDDRVYTPTDLLPLCTAESIPLIYDVHHHRCNPDLLSVAEATAVSRPTWNGRGEPWFHISSPANGWKSKDTRPHSDFITASDFPDEWLTMGPGTVDVEAKQKELAVARLQRWLIAKEKKPKTSTGMAVAVASR